MASEAEEILRRWFAEVWNEGRADAIDRLFAEHGLAHGLGEDGADAVGPRGFKPFHTLLRQTFSDIQFHIEDVVARQDTAAARWSLTMTHAGPGLGIAPTGKPLRATGMSFVRVSNGKIVEAWNNWDFDKVMQQIHAPATVKVVCCDDSPRGVN
jgi:steroid delta-isomerase-like uncharacterized protein